MKAAAVSSLSMLVAANAQAHTGTHEGAFMTLVTHVLSHGGHWLMGLSAIALVAVAVVIAERLPKLAKKRRL